MNFVDFNKIISPYQRVMIDLGTGEGEFVYRQAKAMPDTFCIGIDACKEGMLTYSSKIKKITKQNGSANLLYIVANAENLPLELENCADEIYINLPWGTLREGIVTGNQTLLNNIYRISKNNTKIEIRITYSSTYEKAVVCSRNLPTLDMQYFKTSLKPIYKEQGFIIEQIKSVNNDALKTFDTKWAKKLGYGKEREIYHLVCRIQKTDYILDDMES